MSNKINIALLGYGKMGQMIERITNQHNIEVITHYDENKQLVNDEENRKLLKNVSVLVDFTIPSAVVENIEIAASMRKNMVIGTTGWYDSLPKVEEIIKDKNIGILYGSNFSLGVNLFYKISEYASHVISNFKNYDAYIEESHHKMKRDAPSGTALVLKNLIQKNYPDQELPMSSTRAGYIPGNHSLNFDSNVDSIHIQHIARSRLGLAEGALIAVKWIHHKTGLYKFDTVMDEILG